MSYFGSCCLLGALPACWWVLMLRMATKNLILARNRKVLVGKDFSPVWNHVVALWTWTLVMDLDIRLTHNRTHSSSYLLISFSLLLVTSHFLCLYYTLSLFLFLSFYLVLLFMNCKRRNTSLVKCKRTSIDCSAG